MQKLRHYGVRLDSRVAFAAHIISLVIAIKSNSEAQEAVNAPRVGAGRPAAPPVIERAKPTSGVQATFDYTTEILGNVRGGTSRGAIWEGVLKVGIDVDLEKAAQWSGGTAAVSLLYPHGSGLTAERVHDFHTLSNIDAYDSVRLYEAWFQQELFSGCLSIRAGQILADAEFFTSESASVFINSSFGAIPSVSQNINAPIYPVAAPGVRVLVRPTTGFYIEAAAFSGDAGDPAETNKHNLRFSFRRTDGAVIFAEAGLEVNKAAKPGVSHEPAAEPKLSGSYKLGGYFDSKTFDDLDSQSSHSGNFSVYFVADQQLWQHSGDSERVLSAFLHIGAAPPGQNIVALYGDAGLTLKGPLPARRDDILGIAFSHTQISDRLRRDDGTSVGSHHEEVLELTYQAAIGEHVSVQPDLQFIFNPGALEPAPTAIAGGVRLNVSF